MYKWQNSAKVAKLRGFQLNVPVGISKGQLSFVAINSLPPLKALLCSVRTDWRDNGDTHWGPHWSHCSDTGTNFQTFTPTPRAWRRREGHLSGVCINFPLWHHWLCLLKLFSHHPSVRFIHHTPSIFQMINGKKYQEKRDYSRHNSIKYLPTRRKTHSETKQR